MQFETKLILDNFNLIQTNTNSTQLPLIAIQSVFSRSSVSKTPYWRFYTYSPIGLEKSIDSVKFSYSQSDKYFFIKKFCIMNIGV